MAAREYKAYNLPLEMLHYFTLFCLLCAKRIKPVNKGYHNRVIFPAQHVLNVMLKERKKACTIDSLRQSRTLRNLY